MLTPRRGGIDELIAAIAATQHGVVTRRRLLAAGISAKALDHRIATRRLFVVHRGVYLVGIAQPTRIAALKAAVLACGEQSYLSAHIAPELWRFGPRRPGAIHVTVPDRHRTGPDGVVVHRTSQHDENDIRTHHGIRVSSPALAILDLAHDPDLPHLLAEAIALRLTTTSQLEDLLDRRFTHPGAPALRRMLASDPREIARMRSHAERLMWRLIRQARLPLPEANAVIGGEHVDFAWRQHRLIVEVDGYWFHSTRPKRRNDRRKDAVLRDAGWLVIRVDYDDLVNGREAVLAVIATALAERRFAGE